MTQKNQRNLNILTSMGKRYFGKVDVPNENFRTTDLLNSSNVYWRDPNEKCYDNAVLMHDVKLYIDEGIVYKHLDKIQIKIAEIIYFYDTLETVGDKSEKQRASHMVKQSHEKQQQVNIIIPIGASSFYDITGTFYGLFKKKSRDRFFPITQATILKIYKKTDTWSKREINLPHRFICINNNAVESINIA